ncbi:universal stress protein [Nocardioides bruguierae]|uniref:Universal stress protein n=1 Tax=Nocardioides bruguierae TaxID=2945102 RepID=A0A9X2D7S9_9ACTN|nr:universal stress protein [Nocardioides bruguierae]MCL8024530.1 universal stress protein [Nocardioides bruguierae]MCM0620853.1 universal stress protein [Nocardioides bruguierae]
MSILVAVTDSPEGSKALVAAADEAQLLGQKLYVLNLALRSLADLPVVDAGVEIINRKGRGDRDPVHAVLDEIENLKIDRLVIGIKRRSAVGKALLGSVSQRLLLECPVPVVAVKVDA